MLFTLNGVEWMVLTVKPDDARLIDRTRVLTLATTDPVTNTICVSSALRGTLKKRVLAHEMGHATCFSFGLLDDIHRCCYPWKRIEMEEFICNFVADYGEKIFEITYQVMGDEAIYALPGKLENAFMRKRMSK